MRVIPSDRRDPCTLPGPELLARARTLVPDFARAGLRQTSLMRAPDLDSRAGGRVWLALESLQATGSFKVRGALLALAALSGAGAARRVVAASAGNHGAGVAHAARVLGWDATVVVPRSTPAAKRSRIERAGARLVVTDAAHYDAAEARARELAAREGSVFLSPYDDPAVVAGNGASLGFEIVGLLGRAPARVLVPFGGGGLATGIACAIDDWHRAHGVEPARVVWGAQSEASPAMAMSLERGAAVETLATAEETLADGLEGGISPAAFARAASVVAGVMVVSEHDIGAAMAGARRSLGLMIEGSAAAALAPLLGDLPPPVRVGGPRVRRAPPRPGTSVAPDEAGDVVVVITGRNVDDARLQTVLDDHAGELW